MALIRFIFDGIREIFRGPREYWLVLAGLSLVVVFDTASRYQVVFKTRYDVKDLSR